MKTIILFARAPQHGRVKTRLARAIGPEAALEVYVAMLRDSLDKAARGAQMIGGEAVLAYTPQGAMEMGKAESDGEPTLGELWSGATWPQPSGGLGARMHGAIEWAFGRGSSAVALLGADVPHVSLSELKAGFELLGRGRGAPDVVLGPARDGGFWTLGCRRALPREVFELDWDQNETREPLRRNLQMRQMQQASLQLDSDVDDLPSLRWLAEQLRQKPESAPHTSRWMRLNGWL